MNIFKDNFLKYLKAGYSVIPDIGKKPCVKKWQEYCTRQPNKNEIDEWVGKFPNANIAICCGEQSGVIALDFDELDPEIIKIIEPLLPPSPVERVGSKGFVRFFQWNGEPTQVLHVKDDSQKNGKRVVLEILSNKKKVTIAPSIHPDTKKPYVWTDKELLDIDKKDLPKFPPMLVAHLQSKLQILDATSYSSSEKKITEGRHLSLSTFLRSKTGSPHTIIGMVEELIQFDKNNHEKSYFSDSTEQEFEDERMNALMFYNNHIRSINLKRQDESKELELPIMQNDFAVIDRLIKNDLKEEKVLLPKPTGLIKEIYDYILTRSYIEQPVFALSAAMILVGTLCSRKVVFQNTTPNLYLLNIADSGSGKDSCQKAVIDLIIRIKAHQKILGATTYPSEASIVKDIDIKPTRLDIIDECSTFLKSASKGGADYASGMGDTLCELYSCSNSYYLGKSLASTSLNVGAIHRPHLNLLCSTTYRGINESMSMTALEKGLFARFLVFFGENNQVGKRVISKEKPDEDMLEKLKYWLNYEDMKINSPAIVIGCYRSANDLLTKYHKKFDEMRLEAKSDSYKRPIAARLYQHMMKLALISAVSNAELYSKPIVSVQDVEFAHQLVLYYYQNIVGFVKDNLFESARGMKLNKILKIIKEAGEKGLTNTQLAQKCSNFPVYERMDIIKDLKEGNRIEIEPCEGNVYKFIYVG